MIVPFLDLRAAYQELKKELDAAVQCVLESGQYILGSEVEKFEQDFATYCEAKHAIGVGNGLDAIVLALKALGIGVGDDVLVPSNTYIATWLAVSRIGARPVPVEPDETTYNMAPNRLQAALTKNTRAIIVVHLYGQPADIDTISKFAKENNLNLIEDAAQAHGARYKGRGIGVTGDVICWSFYPGKNLGAYGDSGAVTTNNDDIAERLFMLRNYGSRIRYQHEMLGENSRLDPIQAAMLAVKLKYLDDWNNRRKVIAARYLTSINPEIAVLPFVPSWADPAWHLFVVRSKCRDALQKHLEECGIQTLIHYPKPPSLQAAYINTGIRFPAQPVAEKLAHEILSIPIGPHLSLSQAQHVIESINNFT